MILTAQAVLEKAGKSQTDPNTIGWESIANKWKDVRWPRRPRFQDEFSNAFPLLSRVKGKEALVFGATPEFRSWLNKAGARVSVNEKSAISYAAMSSILRAQFHTQPNRELVIPMDWEGRDYEKGRYNLMMGDIITGYLETKERISEFLVKVSDMLAKGGTFLLRDFVNMPFQSGAYMQMPIDKRRWAYILTPGFAIENGIFYEEKLVQNLKAVNDLQTLATCANPPRTRVMPTMDEMQGIFDSSPLEPTLLVAPNPEMVQPALWMLKNP